MYKQQQIPPVFSMALSRVSQYRTNDGFIALGGLAPVITYGDWGVTPIEYVSLNGGGFYLPTTLPYPQSRQSPAINQHGLRNADND
jgi:hypothetical protein